ncbi:hypothetical protein COV23_00010 [Candidatus Wolfebacteria bacterium CG10_big_fil_rev_8_21_14_0_10_31_9]|uniref:RNA polymerase sigma-70 region 2 domain-containing protein n=1 Tax=Candidatus Wolfebacteria bacterium CG10_big_fil_rev_8_21_14_0_10_31_9 TaxID=1975070 RepID=A0A2H0RCY2_9BACT|nr:MAG: hypothetical protein COV23_00010 [Candidatus Wolfebacteria bacterium CG10_big_fil_rev_8_21_14_0_10_31_9]
MKDLNFSNDKFNKLAEKLKSGDKKSGEEIFNYFSPLIYRFIMARVLNRGVAEDLTQDVFVKVVSKIESFNENQGNFSGWVWQITKNSLIDYYRDKKETIFTDMPEGMENMFKAKDVIISRVKIREVMETVKNFEESDRELFSLYYLSDLPYKEISKITGKTEGSLRVAIHRLSKKIRGIFK